MRFTRKLKPAWPVLALLIPFWWMSFYGLNFGVHWDENRAKFDSIKGTLENGLFLQGAGDAENGGNYNYGGVNYWLTWSGLAPEILSYLWKGEFTRQALAAEISPVLYTTPVRLRVRAIYVILSGLTIVWVFCLCLLLGRNRLESFLAAAILAASWEVAYHSRWIAPDAVMMQFGVLSFVCLIVAFKRNTRYWFYLGAAAAGLAIGTKYPGALLLPFFLVGAAYYLWRQSGSYAHALRHTLGLMAAAIATFLISTPGAPLDPFRFVAQLKEQQETYGAGWFGYSVEPGLHHALEILKYLSLQLFSHYWSISIVFTMFCALGLLAWLWERTAFGILATAFTIGYMAFFAMQSAMLVRNLLVVVPFLCLAAARGIMITAQLLGPSQRRLLFVAAGVLLVVNLGWQVYAAEQVKKRSNSEYFFRQFIDYVRRTPENTVLVSPALSNALHGLPIEIPANIVSDVHLPSTKVAFFQSEGPDTFWQDWPSNSWGMYEATFGALEVNLEAYSTFIGNQRILLVRRERFKMLPIAQKAMLIP